MSSPENSTSEDEIGAYSSYVKNTHNYDFVTLLRNHKVLFNKSQVPKIKEAKEKSIQEIVKQYMKTFGKTITPKQVKKKLQNMKNELKKKTDKNATENKKIILKDWERHLMDLMDVEDNPVFNKVPRAARIGITLSDTREREDAEALKVRLPTKPINERKRGFSETEETKELSTTELQRFVLLEQLRLIRIQTEKEKLIVEKLKQQGGETEKPMIYTEDGNTYPNL